jgi:hypothetical protein
MTVLEIQPLNQFCNSLGFPKAYARRVEGHIYTDNPNPYILIGCIIISGLVSEGK